MVEQFSSKVFGKSNGTDIPGNNFSSFLKLNFGFTSGVKCPHFWKFEKTMFHSPLEIS